MDEGPSEWGMSLRRIDLNVRVDTRDVAERLKVNEETARRLFLNEPGVIVICFPRKGARIYRTLRIPASVCARVVTRNAVHLGGVGAHESQLRRQLRLARPH